MNSYSLGSYGTLRFVDDHWACREAQTSIGEVDLDVDVDGDLPPDAVAHVTVALERIGQIHSLAEAYLQKHAPEEYSRAQPLRWPSLIFRSDSPLGAFTLYFSGADPDDTMCYGIEFQQFSPSSLTIGD